MVHHRGEPQRTLHEVICCNKQMPFHYRNDAPVKLLQNRRIPEPGVMPEEKRRALPNSICDELQCCIMTLKNLFNRPGARGRNVHGPKIFISEQIGFKPANPQGGTIFMDDSPKLIEVRSFIP